MNVKLAGEGRGAGGSLGGLGFSNGAGEKG